MKEWLNLLSTGYDKDGELVLDSPYSQDLKNWQRKTFKIFIHSFILIALKMLYILKSSKFQIMYFEVVRSKLMRL